MAVLIGHTSRVRSVAFSPDGRRLISCDDDKIRVWDVLTKSVLRTFGSGGGSVIWSPDGRFFASGSYGFVFINNATTGSCVTELGGHIGQVNHLAYSPNGRRLVSISDGRHPDLGDMRIWDVNTCAQLATTKQIFYS